MGKWVFYKGKGTRPLALALPFWESIDQRFLHVYIKSLFKDIVMDKDWTQMSSKRDLHGYRSLISAPSEVAAGGFQAEGLPGLPLVQAWSVQLSEALPMY